MGFGLVFWRAQGFGLSWCLGLRGVALRLQT